MNCKKIFLCGLLMLIACFGGSAQAYTLKEISLTDFDNVWFGNAQNDTAKTGVTVAIFPNGARVGVDISGGGPASRETPVLSPTTAPTPVNAIVLSGGSAYGLAASDGVTRWLEDNHIGFDTGGIIVPIVVQSCIYDLTYGSATRRPDSQMGYAACESAFKRGEIVSGNFGAGTGATVGKFGGMSRAQKSGLGVFAIQVGEIKIAAIVVVNAVGDIFDERTGQKIAGLLTDDRKNFSDSCAELYKLTTQTDLFNRTNTTIGMIVTNANFDKAQLTKIASMTRNAYARSIKPVSLTIDGDTIYAASIGDVPADLNLIGTLSAEVMSEAIRRAVESSRLPDEEFLRHVSR